MATDPPIPRTRRPARRSPTIHDPTYDWGDDRRPRTSWADTVIYEAHVKGFTALHPDVPPSHRGTFLGLASPAAIDHLRRLGVTAVELLPVFAHADEYALARRGLTNYWGYNTLGYFAPDPRFATTPAAAVDEFRQMVAALHAAGLEVLIDVVYNHTAEGDHLGPTYSMRGVDNVAYYRLRPGQPSRDDDFTGCGNTVDMRSPFARRLVLDSLRYWAGEMRVDGFRFDLASALARDPVTPVSLAAFFGDVASDPLLRDLKLIVEPWDAAPGGYQLGNFPGAWHEWNDRSRDGVRRFWRGDVNAVPDLATRLAGSSDVFESPGRTPQSGINYVTSHDGFTLADLVSYNDKHNEANGEENQDGDARNLSWNCGVEGPTDNPLVRQLRERQRRNLFLTMAVSLGTPMIGGGDELGRSQLGNNNAYCQDSSTSWTPWPQTDDARAFLDFVRKALTLRATHPALRRQAFLVGREGGSTDVTWRQANGSIMTAADWSDPDRRTLIVQFDDSLLLLFNASSLDAPFTLPDSVAGWSRVIDTAAPADPAPVIAPEAVVILAAHSMAVMTAGDPPDHALRR